MSRSSVGHDQRFILAWRKCGFEVASVSMEGALSSDKAIGTAARDYLQAEIEAFEPDIIQVGPVTDPAWDVAHVWEGPIIATSWGFDLLDEAASDRNAKARARAVLSRADLLFVDNNSTNQRAVGLGMAPERIVQFPWGLDESWFVQRQNEPLDDESRVEILCTRRHEAIYGVGDVLEAFIAASVDYDNVVLRLIGSGMLTTELQARVAAAQLEDRVIFAGEVDNAALPVAYRRADVYVTASSVDGTSVSLLEAMASGTPVLASRIEGNAQWVSESTGFQFDVGDIPQLELLIRQVASMSPAIVEEVRSRASEAFELTRREANWNVTVEKFPSFAQEAVVNHAAFLLRRHETRPALESGG